VPAAQNHAVVVLFRDGREVASWPLEGGDRLDVGMVDQLARLQLAARRYGCSIRLRDPSDELLGLLHLCGLAALLGGAGH
jgi:ABC-type transporter Mla MlaB component